MSRQRNPHKRQPTFRMPLALQSTPRRIRNTREIRDRIICVCLNQAERLVVRDKEVVRSRRRGLEALETVPGHVLDGRESSFGEEEEIQVPMGDDGVVGAFDDGGEGAESRRDGFVVMGKETGATTANEVIGRGSIDDFLDVCNMSTAVLSMKKKENSLTSAVEVVVWTRSERWESHFIPEVRTEICEMIDVEARVYIVDSIVNIIVEITSLFPDIWSRRKWSCWREYVEVLGVVTCVPTIQGGLFKYCHVCVIDTDD
jgi:hypothetical protein